MALHNCVNMGAELCVRSVLDQETQNASAALEHDAPKLTDFGDNIMLQIIDCDHVYDFGLIQSKIIVI